MLINHCVSKIIDKKKRTHTHCEKKEFLPCKFYCVTLLRLKTIKKREIPPTTTIKQTLKGPDLDTLDKGDPMITDTIRFYIYVRTKINK